MVLECEPPPIETKTVKRGQREEEGHGRRNGRVSRKKKE